jgi:hypothetical protein
MAAPRGFEPRFTDPKSAVLPLDEGAAAPSGRMNGAEDGTRTRDPHLGKVMLYQLSHFRPDVDRLERWCRGPGSNWRHRDFQSRALPTELPRPDGQPRWLPVGGPQNTTALRGSATETPGLAGIRSRRIRRVEPWAFQRGKEWPVRCRTGTKTVPDDAMAPDPIRSRVGWNVAGPKPGGRARSATAPSPARPAARPRCQPAVDRR